MAVVKAAGIEGEKRDLAARASKLWRPHRTVKKFLREHFPEHWHGDDDKIGVKECGMDAMVLGSQERRGYFKVIPQRCNRLPYCINCVQYRAWLRTTKRMNRFHCCTPAGEQPRFKYVNLIAPINDDGEGVGVQASNDLTSFGKAVSHYLTEMFGEGIGAETSYHDFGEQSFKKRWPHNDTTLNGWMLDGDTPVHTPRPELKGRGADRSRAAWVRALDAYFDVTDHDRHTILVEHVGTPYYKPLRVGCDAYRKAMAYQVREIVDFRKIKYEHDTGTVWWHSYKDNTRERLTLDQFLEGLEEYNDRLQVWKKGKRNMLHRRYGHLSDRKRKTTQQIMGGVPVPHGDDCNCGRCESWGRVHGYEVKPPKARTLDDAA